MEEEEDSDKEDSFIKKIFSCCIEKKRGELEIIQDETDRDYRILSKSKMIFENDLSVFPTNMIRPEEKNKIIFTKDGIVEYIKNLQELVFPVIYNDNSIKLSKRNYSDIDEKLPLIRCEIIKHKIYFTEVPTIQEMINAIRYPESRKKWDKNVKEYKILGKIKKDAEIVRTVTSKQLSVIPEKEFYDKRIGILKDNIYYLFSSSIPNINYPVNNNYDRAKNIMSIMVIKEDDDNFYIDCFNQIDVNINLPIEFIEANLLNKVNTFCDKYFEFLNILK